jgi:hypothetical protein
VVSNDGLRTAVYNAMLDGKGQMLAAVADVDIASEITQEALRRQEFAKVLKSASVAVVDGNVPKETLQFVCDEARKVHSSHAVKEWGVPVIFEPTSVEKSKKAVDPKTLAQLAVITPNKKEALAMAALWVETVKFSHLYASQNTS